MITLYNIPVSGNCHKVRLLLSFLNIDYKIKNLDITAQEQKSSEYIALNPFGQAPVLLDGDIVIRDSQAILVYLAKKYGNAKWWSDDPVQLAHVHEWLSTASNEITHGPALLRAHHKFSRKIDHDQTSFYVENILFIIENHLADNDWLVGNQPSIADIAIYPYLALAHEGQIDLTPYKNIMAWQSRFSELPGFISMPGIPETTFKELI